jgi:hypothetical protein
MINFTFSANYNISSNNKNQLRAATSMGGWASGRATRLTGFQEHLNFGFLDLPIRIIAYLRSAD